MMEVFSAMYSGGDGCEANHYQFVENSEQSLYINFGSLRWSMFTLGIGFSIVVVCLAALFLLIDFDMIEKGVEARAPKYMEWFGAFALLVTLVWLYLEILKLLIKLAGRK